MDTSVLITGANRGIGLGLAQEFLKCGYTVLASCREPGSAKELHSLAHRYGDKLRIYACDVTQDNSVLALRNTVAKDVRSLDILINNAGILPRSDESIGEVSIEALHSTLETNAIGPFRIAQAFLPLVRLGREKKLIHISSKMGSVSLNYAGGAYSYRMSKAALNILSKNLAIEFRDEGIISLVVHPGWAQTDMGGINASVPVSESLSGLMAIIQSATLAESGRFFNYTGAELSY